MRTPIAVAVVATSVAITFTPLALAGAVTLRAVLLLIVVIAVVATHRFTSERPARHKRKRYPPRLDFLEDAAMKREMRRRP